MSDGLEVDVEGKVVMEVVSDVMTEVKVGKVYSVRS